MEPTAYHVQIIFGASLRCTQCVTWLIASFLNYYSKLKSGERRPYLKTITLVFFLSLSHFFLAKSYSNWVMLVAIGSLG